MEYAAQFICDSYTECEGSEPIILNRVCQTTTQFDYYTAGAAVGLLSRTVVDEGPGKLNLTTEYQYDQHRHPTATIVDPAGLGLGTQYVYSPSGNLLSTTSPGGYYTTNTYDLSNRLLETDRYQDSSMAVQLAKTQYDYNLAGQVTNTRRWWDANDYAESYTQYDSQGRVLNQIDPPDASGNRHGRQFTYDAWGNVIQTAVGGAWEGDENGGWSTPPDLVGITTYANNYQAEGLTASTSDGYSDGVTAYTYDPLGRQATVTQQKQNVDYGQGGGTLQTTLYATYAYDNRGLVTQTVNMTASGGTELNEADTTYDGMGRVVTQSVADGNGHSLSTAYDYDALGRVWQVTDPLGHKTVTPDHAAGTGRRRERRRRQYRRDLLRRREPGCENDPQGPEPGAGTLDADYLWYVTSFVYDTEGRTTAVTYQGEDADYDGVGDAANPLVTQTMYSEEAFKSYVTVMVPALALHHDRLRRPWAASLLAGGRR